MRGNYQLVYYHAKNVRFIELLAYPTIIRNHIKIKLEDNKIFRKGKKMTSKLNDFTCRLKKI